MMNILAFLAETNSGGTVQRIAGTFGVDWQHLAAQIISFSIVCWLLQRFAYKPVLSMLENRRREIEQAIQDKKQIATELAKTESQRQEVLMQANAEAAKLIEEARSAAARVKEQETQKAITAAEQIIVNAREIAARDHDRMLTELKRDVGRLVVQATATVTGKILTQEDQHRLAEETAEQVVA